MSLYCNICRDTSPNEMTANNSGWDWFTGFLPKTFHACAFCLKNSSAEVERQRQLSTVRPPNWQSGNGRGRRA